MRIKKKTRRITLIIIGVLVTLFVLKTILLNANLEKGKQTLLELKSKAGAGEVKYVLDEMEELESLSNPIINFLYQKWKKGMNARFVSQDEIIEHTTKNKIINDISTIYRDYWRTELLKVNPKDRTDSVLYQKVTSYLISNNLTNLPEDSLKKTIKDDTELKRIIESQGFKVDFKYRNGFQELFIWDKETIKNYEVELPNNTINAKVIFIENYHLNGYDYFATMGSSQVGGWALKEEATLYCNKGSYDLTSENFKISYLKHESIHFTDLNKYPNLSSTDLEYRAKVIEFMYCTEETIYDRLAEFLNAANKANRDHSHPFANYSIIKNLSKILFKSAFESDYSKWKNIPVESINDAANQLYNMSEETLKKDHDLSEVI